ncbi:MAG: 1-acyl-sn-glycerol-3-phosphate acyltransferase [Prevotella sp.]|nr:1-acyl-sn-glycerol-3-phosphate acyltransferase [Prevotella sp.]MDD6842775.1 1-acyl-sn-glycerol-3-phosphate acyltransferase [Prevotellaceae bacterium]MCI6559416.1 1-acyl-sn-glycerol-3-phosphate acyltransferase [Prevotella sp.]MDD7096832.1 1-acyl-sn-glycerol-3-phosphate acyltransferase [Prevotellaceae bacterium]MDY5005978.1 1-acyl-sn-glycerol-3-phosphate acyltransferase [Prevotella sp.]
MKVPSEFDAIRPFEPEELPEVMERLIADPQFRMVMGYVFADVPFDALAAKMRQCKDNLSFQYTFPYVFLKQLIAKASTGCDMDHSSIDLNKRYTFISNHRDIVLDSALLDVLLFDAKCTTTCEIAIGDNLLAAPWIKDLVRVNKSFIVERSAGIREMLASSKRLSEYMHFVIAHKHENIWIAQREGRAKDSNDRTQEALLKMMAMGGEGSVADRLRQLHLVPLAISLEYDPCDWLKAREFQLKRDIEGWKKTRQDDVESMRTGIMGYKGQIHYHCAPCIDSFLDTLSADMPKGEVFAAVAQHIDKCIHANYRLYPNNFIALDKLNGNDEHADRYTADDKARFEQYISGQLAKIDIPGKDEQFLMTRMLEMYANPAINHLKAIS